MKDKNKVIGFTIAVVVLLVAIVGISYAWLTMSVSSNKKQVLRVGSLQIILSETNSITLSDAHPMSDSDGMNQTGFEFSIINNDKISTVYSIYLDDDTIASNQTRLDDSYIKYNLTANGTAGTTTTLDSRHIYTGTINSKTTDKFILRVWLNDDIDGYITGQVFKVKLRVEIGDTGPAPVATKLLAGVGKNGAIDTSDSEQTFITGTNPNNYIWYSGKLWRAVSVDPSDNSAKLVTQWNISSIPYNASRNTAFEGSYMQQWLNDTTRDGFLGNLRDYEKFIKTDSAWNATQTTVNTKPAKTTMVTSAVGLLNMYEYTMSYNGTTYSNGYLNNGLYWWTLTPYNTSSLRSVGTFGNAGSYGAANSRGGRPTINLKSSVEIVSGSGTVSDPYRLKGDNDTPTSGTKLATRYSGEYIRFGTGENNLYQIVSHETEGLTKITSAIPLKSSGSYKKMAFASSGLNYSSSNTIGAFLNGEYLTSGSYLTTDQVNMIEDSTTWYLGTVGAGTNYKLAKYASATSTNLTSNTTTAKVGLLRLGELNSGQFDRYGNNANYWTLTPIGKYGVRYVSTYGNAYHNDVTASFGGRPTINLKSNVVITSGDGTKENPFEVKLAG